MFFTCNLTGGTGGFLAPPILRAHINPRLRPIHEGHNTSTHTMPSLSAVKASNQAWRPAFRPVVVVAGGTNGTFP